MDQDQYLERAQPSRQRWASDYVFELPQRWHGPVVAACGVLFVSAAVIGVTWTLTGASHTSIGLGIGLFVVGFASLGAEWVQRSDAVRLKFAFAVAGGSLAGIGGWLAREVDTTVMGIWGAIFRAAPAAVHVVLWPALFVLITRADLRREERRSRTQVQR